MWSLSPCTDNSKYSDKSQANEHMLWWGKVKVCEVGWWPSVLITGNLAKNPNTETNNKYLQWRWPTKQVKAIVKEGRREGDGGEFTQCVDDWGPGVSGSRGV